MNTQAAFAAHWAMLATAFLIAWLALALVVALVYGQFCRLADRRSREVEEMRELLTAAGRDARRAHSAAMIANADALARDVQYARQTARLNGTVRRAPTLAAEDIDSIPQVG
jgi:hypothetical protein